MKKAIVLLLMGACSGSKGVYDVVIEGYREPLHGWRSGNGRIVENPTVVTKASLENGKKLYELNCQPCHGAEGKGNGVFAKNMNPPPRDLTKLQGDKSDYHIFLQVSLGNGEMPGRKETSDNEHWDIVNYVQYYLLKPAHNTSL